MRRWLLLGGILLGVGTGCAPTTLAPMILRLDPGDLTQGETTIGVRSGPRMSVPVATTASGGTSSFDGDKNVFSIPQWGLAYDLAHHAPIANGFTGHLGLQGEFYLTAPLPALGVYAGLSRYFALGKVSLAPTVVGRFTTDFGLPSIGGPSTQAGGEVSVALGVHPEDRITLGLVPFFSYQRLWINGGNTFALYTGAVAVARLRYDIFGAALEISCGYGRVFMPNNLSWNTPILGVRLVL